MSVKRRTKSIIFNLLLIIIILALLYGLYCYAFSSIDVNGFSMEPTLEDGETVLIYKLGDYKVGDVVVFNTHLQSETGDRYFVKRILAMPGDELSINLYEGKYRVYRNGVRLDEQYVDEDMACYEELPSITVPEGKFFFMGDNRVVSKDSRDGLLGDLSSIVGRVVLKYDRNVSGLDIAVVKRAQ